MPDYAKPEKYQGGVYRRDRLICVRLVESRNSTGFCLPRCQIEDSGYCKGDVFSRLTLGRAAMTGLNKIWKHKYITITTKCRIANALVFPVVLCDCESWTIRKAERRIDNI